MNLRPLGDRVIVQRLETERTSAGGIVIPDNAAEKPSKAKVVAVGPGRRLDNGDTRILDVKKGDNILFGKYSGSEIEIDARKFLVLREEDIMAIID
ncbi:MAG: co-chaperone GroES [Gammaproteobacteria bacterium RIFCSPLOWO2_02_FULL_38_11]|nr:MAG: co-chaperone GroES [Gammaproteobacteria bacterium RIFCSPHIGHO2_02_FULL_38_33]OGT24864.1 MAG: co-chaperone GroES [Gammaproteobacteria bacterium RIFCSPHIGHO2_12_38_15]OGT69496.1 MAG: co-chaperone GroES [Gammaproteobacteria bacterium RIFCSPLOWO2_02_FULL_38_11]OGT76927.1 MAG: co-chaperone GroES [Gammaproteobacteria bacterium RIFCSPLOWO2_12_FULL_38_14]